MKVVESAEQMVESREIELAACSAALKAVWTEATKVFLLVV